MKKITFLLAAILFIAIPETKAQSQDCALKANLFNGEYKSKKYDEALVNLNWLLDNCAEKYVSMYQQGDIIAKKKYKTDADKTEALALIKRVYNQRLEHFPKKNPARVHSDYAKFLGDNKLASDDEVFALLEKAYKISPLKMSSTSIRKYFEGVTKRNKDTNPQLVFDTFDDVSESIEEKLEDYAKKILELTKDSTATLDKKQTRMLKAYRTNSRVLGQTQSKMESTISKLATCDRLVPLYQRDFEANKTNPVWLKRSVSRMFNKGCQSEALFEVLVKAYAEAVPSADSYSFVASVLEKNGDAKGAAEMKQKAFDLETNPIKKAKFKLKFAQAAKASGQKVKARRLAREALKFNPNFGKAYLFIARMYQESVNSCGKKQFEKRMVYIIAYNQARKAAAVDASITSTAKKYMKSYKANFPASKNIFMAGIKAGDKYAIKCWIGETITVATK